MPQLSLTSLSSKEFKTTKQADELSARLSKKLGSRHRYEPARLALARSLSIPEQPPAPFGADCAEDGDPIKGQHLFGEDLPLWVALIVQHNGGRDLSARDIQEDVRRHWHRGIHLLMADWKECRDDFERFVLHLAERAGALGSGEVSALAGPAGAQLSLLSGSH